jgi:acyl dehydratase
MPRCVEAFQAEAAQRYAHATDTNQMRDFAAQLVDIEGADSTRLGVCRRGEARARRGTRQQRTIVDQDRITALADATGYHQWIHVDPEGAANRPFGSTIAHGVLTLALIGYLAQQFFRRDFGATRINYELNKVRFPAPVPVGSTPRAKATILDLRDGPAGVAVTTRYLLEIDDVTQTACAAKMLVVLSRRSTDATTATAIR